MSVFKATVIQRKSSESEQSFPVLKMKESIRVVHHQTATLEHCSVSAFYSHSETICQNKYSNSHFLSLSPGQSQTNKVLKVGVWFLSRPVSFVTFQGLGTK